MYLEDKRIRTKVCGLTRLEHARFASGALADYLGFIFWPGSSRYIKPLDAKEIIEWVEGPQCVGVFVDQPIDEVNDTATIAGLDLVQLHGEESPEYCQLIDHAIIKAFRVSPDMSTDHLRYMMDPYTKVVDYFLFDTFIKGQPGGTGKTFNWEVLHGLTDDYPIFLSGGLNPDNIEQAIEVVHPFAVDLSSGLEESPGIKDFSKMEQFFEHMERINESFRHF
jgi:phosphoribosylanthranilate isomerase